MRFTRCNLWISVNVCGYLWISVDICECLWSMLRFAGRGGFAGNSLAPSRAQPYPWLLCFPLLPQFGHTNLQCISDLDLYVFVSLGCENRGFLSTFRWWARMTYLPTWIVSVECFEVSMLRDNVSIGPVFQQGWVSCLCSVGWLQQNYHMQMHGFSW